MKYIPLIAFPKGNIIFTPYLFQKNYAPPFVGFFEEALLQGTQLISFSQANAIKVITIIVLPLISGIFPPY